MPLIKFLTKQNIANTAKNSHEYLGPMVVFSVDLFNVYYVAICMQTAKSLATTLIILTTDSLLVVMALRGIYRRASLLQVERGPSGRPEGYLQDLLDIIFKLFEKSRPLPNKKRQIRLLAPFPLPISDESCAFLKTLSKTRRFSSKILVIRRISVVTDPVSHLGEIQTKMPSTMTTISVKQKSQSPSVHPELNSMILQASGRKIASSDNRKASTVNECIVLDALQTLFHSEYIILAEYIELMIPMLYTLYLANGDSEYLGLCGDRIGIIQRSSQPVVAQVWVLTFVPASVRIGNADFSLARLSFYVDHYYFTPDSGTLWYGENDYLKWGVPNLFDFSLQLQVSTSTYKSHNATEFHFFCRI
ncbi:unnamed protein product [Phytophthora fragariaefolia]|uniref:Unnamed protein product n=1 Tax=Phytophthora fragariaefolia TaxID=1490495 RepID=A0A9W6TZ69_9STRA|nr:unnamed protein product [Phytophthora fragariaefolia]